MEKGGEAGEPWQELGTQTSTPQTHLGGIFFLLYDGSCCPYLPQQGKELKGMPLNESTNF